MCSAVWYQPLVGQTTAVISPVTCGEPDYVVYQSVLADSRLNGRWWKGRDLVLRASTTGPHYRAETLTKTLRQAKPATIAAFLAANERSAVLLSCFAPDLRITVVDPAVLDEIMKSAAPLEKFTGFYAAFPDATGILSVSRVGFGAQNGEALVYVGRTSGPLAGEGYLVLLRQNRGKWRIETKRLVLVS